MIIPLQDTLGEQKTSSQTSKNKNEKRSKTTTKKHDCSAKCYACSGWKRERKKEKERQGRRQARGN